MDDGEDEGDGNRVFTRRGLLLVGLLAVGIAGSGIARRFLGEAGYGDIGVVVFVVGYAGMVLVVWWGWLRPIDITGPAGRSER
jgi:hypothetical protein